MGGVIKLNEKEKWAAYYSSVLSVAGHKDAAKYLHVIAYGVHRPIDSFPEGLSFDHKDAVRIMNAIIDAKREVENMPKKTFKPSLMQDMHDKGEEEV